MLTGELILIAEVHRTIVVSGAIFLIISILNSPALRYFLSRRPFVFLGSISFPLYLLHGTFIRTFLQWAVVLVLPHLSSRALEVRDDECELLCDSLQCKVMASMIYAVWLVLLLAFCRVWKEYVDVLGIQFSRWAEKVILGEKQIEIRRPWRHLWFGRLGGKFISGSGFLS